MSKGSRVGLLIRLGVCGGGGCTLLSCLGWSLLSLMSFSASFNLASGGFLAAPPLISNGLNLPFETQGRSWRLESVPY